MPRNGSKSHVFNTRKGKKPVATKKQALTASSSAPSPIETISPVRVGNVFMFDAEFDNTNMVIEKQAAVSEAAKVVDTLTPGLTHVDIAWNSLKSVTDFNHLKRIALELSLGGS
jgi:hypothetical protein